MSYPLKHRYTFVFLSIIFINAFMDLGHKILIQNTLLQTASANEFMILTPILNAFILLPYILFFTPSGFISDKFSKPKVMFWTAAAAIPITMFITFCYFKGWFFGAFYATLLLGFQAAINSPAKYGHIKEIMNESNLARGNALAQTMAVLGILMGTAVYTVLFILLVHHSVAHDSQSKSAVLQAFAPLGFSLIFLAMLETLLTRFLAKVPAADPKSHYVVKNYFTLKNLASYWQHISSNRAIFFCIISLSIFWGANQVIIVAYGAYIKSHMAHGGIEFSQISLAIAGFGVLFGALYTGKISKGFIETGGIPLGAIGMVIMLFLLLIVTQNKICIATILLLYGFFGGMFIVPLNALIQYHAKHKDLGKVLAGNNFSQNVFMFSFLMITTLTSIWDLHSSTHVLVAVLILTMIVALLAIRAMPQSFVRLLLAVMVRSVYKVQVYGLENIPDQGGVLLLGNHASFLDWAIIQIACPRPVRFVLLKQVYQVPYLKWVFQSLKHIPISIGSSREAFVQIREGLEQGDVVCIFPEGRLSRNGHLGLFHSGFARAIEGMTVTIVPFYLRGLWGSKTSYADSYYKKSSKSFVRKTSITFGASLSSPITAEEVKQAVIRTSSISWLHYSKAHNNIARAIFKSANRSPGKVAMIDPMIPKVTYNTMLGMVMCLKRQWKKDLCAQKNVGIIMPASVAGVIANVTVLAMGKAVVNLNFTAGKENIIFSADQAQCDTIITSRRFLTKIETKSIFIEEWLSHKHIIFFEDFIQKNDKIKILGYKVAFRLLPGFIGKYWFAKRTQPNQTAAIIFSSGSEGRPKGVELTHSNILTNIKQTSTVCNMRQSDVILGMLPLFHSFGFTMCSLMPLVCNVPMVAFADPTDAYNIGKMVARYRITILFGTSTLLGIYARSKKCLPEMFQSLRLIVAGAEKLSPHVQENFKLKFQKSILEGYGTTELAPVAGANLPNEIDLSDMHVQISHKEGTVGMPLPGTIYKIVDPQTGESLPTGYEGMIMVSGPQVMKGYLKNPEKTAKVLSNKDGFRWYETGDKGRLDEDGFLTIVDRYSRFAKIGGEMVSLSALEEVIVNALHNADAEVMAVAIADDKKGEAICLVHTLDKDPADFIALLKDSGLDNLMIPSKYLKVDELPKLGTGKRDYTTAKKMAVES
jgi:acyl-[acyl-carrier-protein]-phospholipid O-acyltransferase/long-chain-fatty-acid--[acyl-carrier-protein] ligase